MNTCSSSQSGVLAEVAVDARFSDRRTTLTYSIPEHLASDIGVGQLVWAPLRKGLTVGVVCELHSRSLPDDVSPRPVHAPVEPTFRLSPAQWELAVWIAEETVCTIFEAASVMLPPGVETRGIEHLELIDPHAGSTEPTALQQRLIDYLQSHPEAAIGAARKALGSSLASVIPALEDAGVLRRVVRVRNRPASSPRLPQYVRLVPDADPPPDRAAKQKRAYEWLSARLRTQPELSLPLASVLQSDLIDRPVLRSLAERGVIAIEPGQTSGALDPSSIRGPVLTDEQRAAWSQIQPLIENGSQARVLVHGVTGSGKTELYFRAATETMSAGRSAILLVPEIALASQVIERAIGRFGSRAIILHSAMNDRERYDNWRRCASGDPVIVVGPRSALFAPLPDVGLIVLDEEQEPAYKQDSVPRYHARSVAIRLAEIHGATLILGSATPDVESYYRSLAPEWLKLELTERVGQRTVDASGQVTGAPIALPDVRVIDMRAELRKGNRSLFSQHLTGLLHNRMASNEQVILFLNRRGASTMVQCRSCGHVVSCPMCDIPMVYHRDGNRLTCHRCGHRNRPPRACAECGSVEIGYYGAGTQRIEAEVKALLPGARVQRWDRDVLRGNITHDTLLRRIERHEVDIIVGTQMVAKGLDLPDVTAVGVINADTFLHLPDFRSAERTFQMLTQVAGRAGRRASGSEVVIQSYSPEHYTIQHAAQHDFHGFYQEEIAYRRQHGYPPFKRLARLVYRHASDVEARIAADDFCSRLEDAIERSPFGAGIDMLGPAPAFAARIRGRYGWQILLRGDNCPALLANMTVPFGWVIDIDPVSLL
jgi:primosomal protein N' (replication factor Y) (superfamily II helicase)